MNFIRGKVVYNLPIGDVLILSDGIFLKKLIFLNYEKVNFHYIESDCQILKKAEKFLIDYFERKIWYQFEFINYNSLNPILKRTIKIPFGKFLYYSDFSKFPRYVGKILSLNEIPVFVPCHRVISKFGIGGYTPSIEIKKILLKHEGIISF
ncbi:MAG: methylated-DNA--[protein]-cysteine S-methyltransferase [candidate division WOR-3 bacterium]